MKSSARRARDPSGLDQLAAKVEASIAIDRAREAAAANARDAAGRDEILAAPRSNLIDFTTFTNPRYQVGWFNRAVAAELDQFYEDVVAGLNPRLMLLAPPRLGKSELVSRRFPAQVLGKNPTMPIIGASYAADLAERTNRDVQRIIDTPLYAELYPGSKLMGPNVRASGSWVRNNKMFEIVDEGGSYRAAGVGGGITGMGARIGIIDDPVKDAEQAASKAYRKKVWEWYLSTFYSRFEEGGGILLVMTRWHMDDLAGRLLKAAARGEGDQWRVVRFPAISEDRNYADADPRGPGEALHPERYSLKRLQAIKTAVGPYVWASLYQGDPRPREGNLFDVSKLSIVKALPAGFRKCARGWDFAATKQEEGKDPDWTAGVKMSRYSDGRIFVEDVVRNREDASAVRTTLKATADRDAVQSGEWGCRIRMPQDPGQAGKDQAQGRVALLAGHQVTCFPVTGDKETRAEPFSAQVAAGNVYLLEGPWNDTYIEELRDFPSGDHDDQVDASTDSFAEVVGIHPGENLAEYYRQEAERILAEREAEGRRADPAAVAIDGVLMKAPAGTSQAHGRFGDLYMLGNDGTVRVLEHDVGPFMRIGWLRLDDPPPA